MNAVGLDVAIEDVSDAASVAWSPDRQRIAFVRPSER
jgi:hypothetical protein